jgi:hypothetical protein
MTTLQPSSRLPPYHCDRMGSRDEGVPAGTLVVATTVPLAASGGVGVITKLA